MTSVEDLIQAAAEFMVDDLDLAAEPAAAAAAQQSLDDSGLLLLGEMHGAQENPLLARALMQAFGITRLALEWDEDLAPLMGAFLACRCRKPVPPGRMLRWLPGRTPARAWDDRRLVGLKTWTMSQRRVARSRLRVPGSHALAEGHADRGDSLRRLLYSSAVPSPPGPRSG